jgi:hypothetical protein
MVDFFKFWYEIHPVLPIPCFLIFIIGITAPPLYCSVKKIPYNFEAISSWMKGDDKIARFISYAFFSSLLLLFISSVGIILPMYKA